MKADIVQQHSLLEVSELDAELSKLAHRAAHLPERQELERINADQVAANDRLGALQIALEDLDTQISRFEAEIDGVRQREDRDRSLLQSVADSKQLSELQHELETLQRRQASLEDSLLEVMEHREQLQVQQTTEQSAVEALQADSVATKHALDTTLGDIEHVRRLNSSRREELIAALDPELVALYERQRAGGGPGAAPLQGRRCGACRIEIDRGEMSRISAAPEDDVLRCPECGAILLRVKGVRQ
jgi:predicted  nucleic acid-binding Zn-ribbon protein